MTSPAPRTRSRWSLPPLSVDAVTALAGDRDVDPVWLHRVTGGNAFFVCEMLDHDGADLPTTVRDAILARTAELDARGVGSAEPAHVCAGVDLR